MQATESSDKNRDCKLLTQSEKLIRRSEADNYKIQEKTIKNLGKESID